MEGRGEGRGGVRRALKEEEEEEEDEMRMHCLCTIGDSRRSSICMRREREAAWNGALSLSLDSHRLHRHSGLCVNGRDSEQVCIQHVHVYSVKCNDCLGEGRVSKVRGGCILGLCRMLFIQGV